MGVIVPNNTYSVEDLEDIFDVVPDYERMIKKAFDEHNNESADGDASED